MPPDDLARLVRVARPVHVSAVRLDLGFEPHQQLVEARERMRADRARVLAQPLDVGQLRKGVRAFDLEALPSGASARFAARASSSAARAACGKAARLAQALSSPMRGLVANAGQHFGGVAHREPVTAPRHPPRQDAAGTRGRRRPASRRPCPWRRRSCRPPCAPTLPDTSPRTIRRSRSRSRHRESRTRCSPRTLTSSTPRLVRNPHLAQRRAGIVIGGVRRRTRRRPT